MAQWVNCLTLDFGSDHDLGVVRLSEHGLTLSKESA